MNKRYIFFAVISIFSFGLLSAQSTNSSKKIHEWWNDQYPNKVFKCENYNKLPQIKVSGNSFVTPDGKPIIFKGMSISDPDKIENQGHWNKAYFEKAKEWGAMLIRIPVHPIAWRERGTDAYIKLLDQAVEWCSDLGIYVLIDWHSIGNLKAGLFQDPMYQTSIPETSEFWRTIARHYKGCTTVAFYELYNEPTIYGGQLGTASWADWKKINEDLINLIRAFDKDKVELVAGFDWAYDLTPLNLEPINAEGIGYVVHPYPHKRSAPYELKFDENFGFAASKYPIMATEIGLILGDRSLAQNSEYAKMIIPYFESRGISWLAWVFDPEWDPTMFKSWDTFEPTDNGLFFKNAMLKKK